MGRGIVPRRWYPPQSMISPNTLLGATMEAMRQGGTPAYLKKKKRKRPARGVKASAPSSSSQPELRLLDKLPSQWRQTHWLGEPILPQEVVSCMTGDMRSVHDTIRYLVEELLKSQSPSYPLHIVKVPKDMGFVDKNYGDVFFIRYDESSTSSTSNGSTDPWSA